MKKTLVALLAIVSVFCTFCLTACGGSKEASIAGTYKFFSMTETYNGETETTNVGDEIYPGIIITEDFMVVELKEDGTFIAMMEGEESGTGTWVKSGNNVVVTPTGEGNDEDETVTFKLDGDTLTMEETEEYEGETYSSTMVLKKAQNSNTSPSTTPTTAPTVTPSVSESSIVGTYKFQSMSMTYEGVTQTVNAGDTYSGVTLDENYIVMELKEDGTAKMSTTLAGTLVDESIGTWVQDGGNVVITIDDEPEIATIYGDFLIIEGTNEGYTNEVVLKK